VEHRRDEVLWTGSGVDSYDGLCTMATDGNHSDWAGEYSVPPKVPTPREKECYAVGAGH